MTGERERLPRLLALVPYLQAHDGIAIEQAAADFDISEDQLRRDLQLLWMCGLPGHGPGDLIDLSFDGETVSVDLRRRHVSPAAPDCRRGSATRRRAAHAGRDAGHHRSRRRRARAGQGRVRGQRIGRGADGGGRTRPRLAADPGAAERDRRTPRARHAATTRPLATRPPTASSIRCGSSRWTVAPTSRHGVGVPRGCGSSASIASTTPRSSTSRPTRRPTRSCVT